MPVLTSYQFFMESAAVKFPTKRLTRNSAILLLAQKKIQANLFGVYDVN